MERHFLWDVPPTNRVSLARARARARARVRARAMARVRARARQASTRAIGTVLGLGL